MLKGLDNWVNRISDVDLPIFKYTVNAINKVVSAEDTSTAQLAEVILHDASLTARILRIANSTTYNPGSTPINTISRAITFIGFDMVRDLSLSLAVIEALLSKKNRKYELQLMARAFHAAVQARALALEQGDDSAEEVFIAALLYHIGEMTFWCVANEEADAILEHIEEKGYTVDMAQREVLGFSFDQLTIALTRNWHLSDLLHSAINNPTLSNSRIQNILFAQQLARQTEHGWDGSSSREIIKKIARHTNMEAAGAKDWLCENAKQAAQLAEIFGATAIIEYLPIPDVCKTTPQSSKQETVQEFPQPNPVLQLSVLRDLSRMMEEKPRLNLLLEIILEGIYRGVGMDRALFALLSPDKKTLCGKHALGKDNRQFTDRFNFDIKKNNIFRSVLLNNNAVWVKDTLASEYNELIGVDIRNILASKAFFICPLIINDKPAGAFYADRQPSNRLLDSESFEAFQHFCHQAGLSIEHLSPPKR